MKHIFYSLISCFVLMLCTTPTYSVVAVHKTEVQESDANETAREAFKSLSEKQQRKLKKRMTKLKKKMEKRMARKNKKAALDIDVIQEPKFRLGALVFLAGLAVLLLAALFIGFSGLVIWVGNLAVLIGLILMVWSIIEY